MHMRHFMEFYGIRQRSVCGMIIGGITHPHFIPDIVISLQHRKVMLYGHNETMTV